MLSAPIEIGYCINRLGSNLTRIHCFANDGLNFCCRLFNSSNLIDDFGERTCCSHEEYSDQHWATLATIQGYTTLTTLVFIFLMGAIGWLHFITYDLREADLTKSRRQVIKHLLKRQLLHRSRAPAAPTAIGSLARISQTLSSSSGKWRRQVKKKGESDERKDGTSEQAKPVPRPSNVDENADRDSLFLKYPKKQSTGRLRVVFESRN